ncbi:hypothetical protein, partial [Lactiplantibacillus plantarum]
NIIDPLFNHCSIPLLPLEKLITNIFDQVKSSNKKVALIRQSTQLDSTTPSEHLLYGLIELTHYLPHFSM